MSLRALNPRTGLVTWTEPSTGASLACLSLSRARSSLSPVTLLSLVSCLADPDITPTTQLFPALLLLLGQDVRFILGRDTQDSASDTLPVRVLARRLRTRHAPDDGPLQAIIRVGSCCWAV